MNFNANSPTIKRLMSEMRTLQFNPEKDFVAGPVGDNLFLWHFTIKGPRDTPFEGGIYHGKIVFPQQYPYSPPDIYFLTPNGRFETGKKICLTITSFHPDQWNPAWDVRTALTSIIAFMPTPAEGAVGALDTSDEERRHLAKLSHSWHCKECSLEIKPDEIKDKNEKDANGENAETEKENTEKENAEKENAENADNDDNKHNDIEDDSNNNSNNDNANIELDEDNENNQEPQHVARNAEIENPENEKGDLNANDDESNKDSNVKQEKEPDNAEKPPQTGPYVDEEGISHYNFEELHSIPFESKQSFICILDIPIIILFFLLLFLIANSAFNFVHFFDFD